MCQQVILVQYTIHSMFICLYCLLNQHPWNVCPLSFIPMKSDLLNQTIQSRRARKQNAITIPKNVHSTLITSFSELGTADSSLNNPSSLKIHQNAVFYILTRTWIHLLKSQAKNHATSSFSQKINTFRLLALYFFSLRTIKKPYLVLKSKNAAIYTTNSR